MKIKIEKDYQEKLNQVIDEIFSGYGKTWTKLARSSGLSYGTVCRIGRYKTKLPQLRTVYRLAKTAGMSLTLVKKQTGIGIGRRKKTA